MIKLLEAELIDPELEIHYAYHKSLNMITGIHCHDFYEFFLIPKGSLFHMINGAKIILHEGSLVFIRPRDLHFYETIDDHPCELLNLAFPQRTLNALFRYLETGFDNERILNSEMPPMFVLTKSQIEMLVARFQELSLIPPHNKHRIKGEARVVLADLFMRYFSQEEPSSLQDEIPEWLGEIQRQMKMKEHFTAGLPRMHELSLKSPEHLSRMFKKYIGTTPTQWVNGIRLQYAANLLSFTDEPILSVCYESGFENLSHFNHQFKRYYAHSPSSYRKSTKKIIIPG